jgi:hypothetical protein
MAGVLPEIPLLSGGFFQINEVLQGFGLDSGRVRVERVSGAAPYYCYGVINDQSNSDGSFIDPQPEVASTPQGLILPVIVETDRYASELILTNWSKAGKVIDLEFVTDSSQFPFLPVSLEISLKAGEQVIVPEIVNYLRQKREGVAPLGTTITGALFATVENGDCNGLFLAARTTTNGSSGKFGLFYSAVPYGSTATQSVWLYGLQQNEENRSNLALVNTGETDSWDDTFSIELYDGNTGKLVNTVAGLVLPARGWKQINMILAQYAPQVKQGYAHVVRTNGSNPFIAYAVVNDGAQPGERTGDGAFISSAP